MRNPLHKRFPRQLKSEAGKYLGIFLLLVISIGAVSGFLSVCSSIERISSDSFETYHIEDGRFQTEMKATAKAIDAVEDCGVTVYENFSHELTTEVDGMQATIRLHQNRDKIDISAIYEGQLPTKDNEVALDDTFAAHHNLHVGDTLSIAGKPFRICGLIVLPDYSSLLKNNNDLVMDTITFSVGLVSKDGFARFKNHSTTYTYSFFCNDPHLSLPDRATVEKHMAKALIDHGARISDMIDVEENQGVQYVSADADGDKAMYMTLLYMLIIIMGFVFLILTNATIEQEAPVIGTLLASGWRKSELLRHYLFLPAIVGLVACAVGNILGYTVLVEPFKNLYYNSYSLPPFHNTFNVEAFLLTTVLPYAMLVGITLVGLMRKLKCTPLQFLRTDIRHKSRRHTVHLPERLGYIARFRLRVLLRGLPTFLTLFIGIIFSSLLLTFATAMMPSFQNYADQLAASLPAEHVYTLKAPYELEMTDSQQKLRNEIDALAALEKGIETVQSAGDQANSGVAQFGQGLSSAAAGSTQLSSAVNNDLMSGTDQLKQGSSLYLSGLETSAATQRQQASLVDVEGLKAAYATAFQNYLAAYTACLQSGKDPRHDASVTTAYASLAQTLQDLVTAAGTKGGATGAATALDQAASGYRSLDDGIQTFSQSLGALAEGSSALSSGMHDLTAAQGALASGIDAYTAGVDKLLSAAKSHGASGMANDLARRYHPVAKAGSNSKQAIDQAEKIAVTSMDCKRTGTDSNESVTVYGIQQNSKFWHDIDVSDGKIVAGLGLVKKCSATPGSTLVMYDKYNDKYYAFKVDAANGNETDTNLYMSIKTFNKTFGNEKAWFNGYMSNEPLKIDNSYLAKDTTPDDMQAIARQMLNSSGSSVQMIMIIALLIFFVVMYLLTKTVLDRSARSISYMKVFGYRDREINRLYVRPITIAVVVSLVAGLPIVNWLIRLIFETMMLRYSGNIVFTIGSATIIENLALGFVTYLLVAFLHVRRIKRIPLELALKVQE